MPFLPKMQALDAANAVLAAVSVYVLGTVKWAVIAVRFTGIFAVLTCLGGNLDGYCRSFYRHFCGFNVFGRYFGRQ